MSKNINLACPACAAELLSIPAVQGPIWKCSRCEGHLVSNIALVKIGARDTASRIWEAAARRGSVGPRDCPHCRLKMIAFTTDSHDGSLPLDRCGKCYSVWFDRDELAAISSLKAGALRANKTPKVTRAAAEPETTIVDILGDVLDIVDEFPD